MTNHHQPEKPKSNRKLISMLVMGCIGMFGFGFALVPLYDVLCEKLGINGKTSNTASSYQAITIDTSRIVTVEFISQVQTGMPWKFEPQTFYTASTISLIGSILLFLGCGFVFLFLFSV